MSEAINHKCFHKTYIKVTGINNETLNDLTILKSELEVAKFNLIYFGGDIQVR